MTQVHLFNNGLLILSKIGWHLRNQKMAQPKDWSVTTFSGLIAHLGFLSSVLSRLKYVGLIDISSRHISQLWSLLGQSDTSVTPTVMHYDIIQFRLYNH